MYEHMPEPVYAHICIGSSLIEAIKLNGFREAECVCTLILSVKPPNSGLVVSYIITGGNPGSGT